MNTLFSPHALLSLRAVATRVAGGLLAGLLLASLTGCDTADTDGPTGLSGSFTATTLAGQLNAEEGLNLLEADGGLSFSFEENGTVAGTFVVPAEISESGTIEEQPLAGTYVLESDGDLRFDFGAAGSDTFIGAANISWRYDGDDDVIRGNAGGFQAVLERAP